MICDSQITKSNSGECNHGKINGFKIIPICESINYCSRYKQKECKTKNRIQSPIDPDMFKLQLVHTLKMNLVRQGLTDSNRSVQDRLATGMKTFEK